MNKSLEMIGDYVRHLEEENAILKKRNKELEEGFQAITEELCEYATKIDKAIEYLKQHFMYHIENDKENIFFEDNYIQDLFEILGDKENE